jgi:RAB protein geranylgeranyltransferase component A
MKYLSEKKQGLETSNQDGFSDFKVLKSYDYSKHKAEKDFKRDSRQYNIDLVPKLLFSKSTSVDLLIKSGAANYLEFQGVP